MGTRVIPRVPVIVTCPPAGELKVTEFPPQGHVSPFQNTSHASLQVWDSLESPNNVQVTVLDGFSGKRVMINMMTPDTIGKLKQEYLKMKPELQGDLNLAFNGKPVCENSTLAQLGVKTGAMFITFHRCIGG